MIERAVSASGLTRTDFVLQIPRAGPFEGFRRLLDAPPNPSAHLKSTMASPTPSPLTMAPPTLIAAMTASTTGSSAVPSAISAAEHHA